MGPINRRKLLTAVLAGSVTIAGCMQSGDDDEVRDGDDTTGVEPDDGGDATGFEPDEDSKFASFEFSGLDLEVSLKDDVEVDEVRMTDPDGEEVRTVEYGPGVTKNVIFMMGTFDGEYTFAAIVDGEIVEEHHVEFSPDLELIDIHRSNFDDPLDTEELDGRHYQVVRDAQIFDVVLENTGNVPITVSRDGVRIIEGGPDDPFTPDDIGHTERTSIAPGEQAAVQALGGLGYFVSPARGFEGSYDDSEYPEKIEELCNDTTKELTVRVRGRGANTYEVGGIEILYSGDTIEGTTATNRVGTSTCQSITKKNGS